MLSVFNALSPFEQIAQINLAMKNTEKFTRRRFDCKRIKQSEYTKIRALKTLRLQVIRQNRHIFNVLCILFILSRALTRNN